MDDGKSSVDPAGAGAGGAPLPPPMCNDAVNGTLPLGELGMRGACFSVAAYPGMREGDYVSLRFDGGASGAGAIDFDVTSNWVGKDLEMWVPWPRLKTLAARHVTVDYVLQRVGSGVGEASTAVTLNVEAFPVGGAGRRRRNADEDDEPRVRGERKDFRNRTRWQS